MPITTGVVNTSPAYSDTATLGPNPLGVQVAFNISKAPAIAQIARIGPNPKFDSQELFLAETQQYSAGFKNCSGIRFRSADPVNPATIYASLFLKGEFQPIDSFQT